MLSIKKSHYFHIQNKCFVDLTLLHTHLSHDLITLQMLTINSLVCRKMMWEHSIDMVYTSINLSKKMQRESLERQQKLLNRKIVTEILPTKKHCQVEEYHQQYLEKGLGCFIFKQSTFKGPSNQIRCYH